MSCTNADHPATVNGDRGRLEQVFVNVLANAVKYTPPGGRITVALDHSDGRAVVRVTDTGVGIDAASLDHVFDLFHRGSVPVAERGLGIGLTVTRRLVELHGGTITVTSRGRGCGSEFTVTLPALAQSPTRAAGVDHNA